MLLIGNGRLVTRDEEMPYLESGGVLLDGPVIREVGTLAALGAAYPDAEFLDARGGVIMPGLINVHHHIYSAFARGLSIRGHNPKNFMDILEGLWWRLDRTLNLKDVEYSALATMADCVKNGVTTLFDHHASYGAVEDSLFVLGDCARTLGIRANLCYEVSDREGEAAMRRAVAENCRWIEHARADQSGMLAGMMGLHAAFTLSDETLALCRERTPADTGVHIHVAEGIDDVYDSLKKHGKRVVNRLFDLDLLGEKTLAVHCVHINAHEMELLRETGTLLAHNPESNMGNAVGCPPTLEMLRRGLTVGLGTDGYTSDMLESYKVANLLHKHNTCDPNAAWGEIPQMLFSNNAVIANRYFKPPLGVLRAGAAGDVIVA
ncbi:MAG: putative aminohydrolase SsnA, partial [Oscillospiraceae bacterium]